ncbi:MAG: sialate O-acetylesterase [Polaribacter sp.]|nr:sialate O-acetylesterase [Polaribacter sp.]
MFSCSKNIEDPGIIEPGDGGQSTIKTTLTKVPLDNQLYARNTKGDCIITIAGTSAKYNSIAITIKKEGAAAQHIEAVVTRGEFSKEVIINAELKNYTFDIFGKEGATSALIEQVKNVVCGDVYVIHGQSNAWAQDYDNKYNDNDLPASADWVRTIGAMHVYSKSAILPHARDTLWYKARGKAPDLSMQEYVGSGMVGVLGINLGVKLVDSLNVPIAIINGAGGGGSIDHYLSSADSHQNTPYDRLSYRLNKGGVRNAIKGFVWNQGESNGNASVDSYKSALKNLYNSLNSDFSFEKFYLVQTPPGCASLGNHAGVREAQRQFAVENENIRLMTRHGFLPDQNNNGNYFLSDGCHYHAHAYETLANWIGNLILDDFYDRKLEYDVPKIVDVTYAQSADSIFIKYDRAITVQQSLSVAGVSYDLKDFISISSSSVSVTEVGKTTNDEGKVMYLKLSGVAPNTSSKLTYLTHENYPSTSKPYIGPWITSLNSGVGAPGFVYELPPF